MVHLLYSWAGAFMQSVEDGYCSCQFNPWTCLLSDGELLCPYHCWNMRRNAWRRLCQWTGSELWRKNGPGHIYNLMIDGRVQHNTSTCNLKSLHSETTWPLWPPIGPPCRKVKACMALRSLTFNLSKLHILKMDPWISYFWLFFEYDWVCILLNFTKKCFSQNSKFFSHFSCHTGHFLPKKKKKNVLPVSEWSQGGKTANTSECSSHTSI